MNLKNQTFRNGRSYTGPGFLSVGTIYVLDQIDNCLFRGRGDVLCIVGCLAVSLASTH